MILTVKEGVAFDVDSLALGRMFGKLLLMPAPLGWTGVNFLTITSGSDGAHKPGSRHYFGEALDLRTRGWTEAMREMMRAHIETWMGTKFRCLDEVDHLHLQVRKGMTYP